MTTQKQLTPIGQICQCIDKMEGSLNESLQGTGVSVKRFLATAKTAIQTHGDQDKLANADRNSLYLAIKKAASDGLMPDNREAALVIYNNKQPDGSYVSTVQYQPMVQGLVKLARNSGEIKSLGAYIVYENDDFSYRAGVDPIPQHQADWFSNDRGKPIGIWAFVKLKTGGYLDPVMLTQERINRIASRSKQAKNYNPGQGKDWEEFWKKTAIRNILKYAPRSTALDSALMESDDEFDFEKDDITLEQKAPPRKRTTKAAKVVKEQGPEPDPTPDPTPEPEEEPIEGEVVKEEEDLTEEIPV